MGYNIIFAKEIIKLKYPSLKQNTIELLCEKKKKKKRKKNLISTNSFLYLVSLFLNNQTISELKQFFCEVYSFDIHIPTLIIYAELSTAQLLKHY